MFDAILYGLPLARRKSTILKKHNIENGDYCLATIHRPANTDNLARLKEIISAFNQISETIILPLHPRTRKALSRIEIKTSDYLKFIDPVGYLDMLILEENARLIATDSGGVQREAYYLGIPCLTLREETEWVATVEFGWNKLVGVNQTINT